MTLLRVTTFCCGRRRQRPHRAATCQDILLFSDEFSTALLRVTTFGMFCSSSRRSPGAADRASPGVPARPRDRRAAAAAQALGWNSLAGGPRTCAARARDADLPHSAGRRSDALGRKPSFLVRP